MKTDAIVAFLAFHDVLFGFVLAVRDACGQLFQEACQWYLFPLVLFMAG